MNTEKKSFLRKVWEIFKDGLVVVIGIFLVFILSKAIWDFISIPVKILTNNQFLIFLGIICIVFSLGVIKYLIKNTKSKAITHLTLGDFTGAPEVAYKINENVWVLRALVSYVEIIGPYGELLLPTFDYNAGPISLTSLDVQLVKKDCLYTTGRTAGQAIKEKISLGILPMNNFKFEKLKPSTFLNTHQHDTP